MNEALILKPPAKLNLFLQIVGRRRDGYHLLQTAFQLIDLCDELRLEARSDGRVVRESGAQGVPEGADLCVRAASLLKPLAPARSGVSLWLNKRIPMGGGLGGGSSDAAAVLHGLNRLWKLGLSIERLAELGLSLGADVPLFVHGRSAWGEGVGERLQAMDLGDSAYLVLDSGISVATAELFQAPELTRDAPPATIAGFLSGNARGNAFELPLVARAPAVGEALQALRTVGGPAALQVGLSGTGGCCFARFARVADAEHAQLRLGEKWRSWVCRGINRSPVIADGRG